MCIDVLLHFLHTPAVRMNIYLGKRRTGQGTRFFFKERKFIQDCHKLNDRIKSLLLGSKRIQQRIYFEYGRHRETKPFLCFIQHPADRVELILIDKALEEKIGRKLNRNLPYLFRMAVVLFPDVFQIFSCYQYQIIITYHFGRVSYNPPYSGSLFGEVQFKLGVVVYRISEFRFITFRNVKAILI